MVYFMDKMVAQFLDVSERAEDSKACSQDGLAMLQSFLCHSGKSNGNY